MDEFTSYFDMSSKIDELLSWFVSEQRSESDPRLSEPLCVRIVSENMDHIGSLLIENRCQGVV